MTLPCRPLPPWMTDGWVEVFADRRTCARRRNTHRSAQVRAAASVSSWRWSRWKRSWYSFFAATVWRSLPTTTWVVSVTPVSHWIQSALGGTSPSSRPRRRTCASYQDRLQTARSKFISALRPVYSDTTQLHSTSSWVESRRRSVYSDADATQLNSTRLTYFALIGCTLQLGQLHRRSSATVELRRLGYL